MTREEFNGLSFGDVIDMWNREYEQMKEHDPSIAQPGLLTWMTKKMEFAADAES